MGYYVKNNSRFDTVLFDLDGTLLPVDQDLFVKTYFAELAKKLAPHGFEPKRLVNAVLKGTDAMVANDGTDTNETRFWEAFEAELGPDVRCHEPLFESFYMNEFDRVRPVASPTPLARECVKLLKEKGYKLVLATNPIFPRIATVARLGWAGLEASDFDLITTYENSSFSKPSLGYFGEILTKIGKRPDNCLMIGNDVQEDMLAEQLGMRCYLLTDRLIHRDDTDISGYERGSMEDLLAFIKALPVVS